MEAKKIEELHEVRKKELEKQLLLLSKLSEKEDLTVQEHLNISAEIRQIILLL